MSQPSPRSDFDELLEIQEAKLDGMLASPAADADAVETWGPQVSTSDSEHMVELVARAYVREREWAIEQLCLDRGRFVLTCRLSESHHSHVFLAIDRVLEREVIVKIHKGVDLWGVHPIAYDEARLQARVEHPNITVIHDIGVCSSFVYAVVERCNFDLWTWRQLAVGGRFFDWRESLDLCMQAGVGLAYLHEIGLVHGDVKPQNIFIKGNIAKLGDFGTAEPHPSVGPARGGTTGFNAPEVRTIGRSPATDSFAFAVTVWFTMFGAWPWGTATGESLVAPPELPRGMPWRFIGVLAGALDPDPRRRTPLPVLLAELLAIREQPIRRRRSSKFAAAAAALISISAGMGWTIAARGPEPRIMQAALDPLTRAELAARAGDGSTAATLAVAVYDGRDDLSAAELERTIDALARIAAILRAEGDGHCVLIQSYVDQLIMEEGSNWGADYSRSR